MIRDYHDNPPLEFYGIAMEDDYYGIELEIESIHELDMEEKDDDARDILEWAWEELHAQEDGSLDDGFEIVSQPCSFEYHMDNIDWTGLLQEASNVHDYRSHDAETCGLHIHISRKGFGSTEHEQDMNIAKLLYFFEKHWEKIKRFSRRTSCQLREWASRYLDEDDPIDDVCHLDLLDAAKKSGRYFAVNLSNPHTVELRVFRGTLNVTTFYATLQFTKYLRNYIVDYSLEEVQNTTWQDFAEYLESHGNTELNTYLKQRKINSKKENVTYV